MKFDPPSLSFLFRVFLAVATAPKCLRVKVLCVRQVNSLASFDIFMVKYLIFQFKISQISSRCSLLNISENLLAEFPFLEVPFPCFI